MRALQWGRRWQPFVATQGPIRCSGHHSTTATRSLSSITAPSIRTARRSSVALRTTARCAAPYAVGQNWHSISGGDGGYVAVDKLDTNVLYSEFTGKSLQRSLNGGATWAPIHGGVTEARWQLPVHPSICDGSNGLEPALVRRRVRLALQQPRDELDARQPVLCVPNRVVGYRAERPEPRVRRCSAPGDDNQRPHLHNQRCADGNTDNGTGQLLSHGRGTCRRSPSTRPTR